MREDELDSAALYRALADASEGRRRDVLEPAGRGRGAPRRALGEAACGRPAITDFPDPTADAADAGPARTLARRFGADAVLPLVLRLEAADAAKYRDVAEAHGLDVGRGDGPRPGRGRPERRRQGRADRPVRGPPPGRRRRRPAGRRVRRQRRARLEPAADPRRGRRHRRTATSSCWPAWPACWPAPSRWPPASGCRCSRSGSCTSGRSRSSGRSWPPSPRRSSRS